MPSNTSCINNAPEPRKTLVGSELRLIAALDKKLAEPQVNGWLTAVDGCRTSRQRRCSTRRFA